MSNPKMISHKHRHNGRGFTLLEMLCVLGIIAVLMGLLLGPVSRVWKQAAALKWAEESQVQLERTVKQLRSRYQGKAGFPVVTLEQIEIQAWLEPPQLQFLKDRRVNFTPFAGRDPDDKVVIQVTLEPGFFTEAGTLMVTKEEITKIPL